MAANRSSYMLPGKTVAYKPPTKRTMAPSSTSSYKPPAANTGFKLHGGPVKQTTHNPVPGPSKPTTPAPAPTSAPVLPFLTPDQQGALNNAWSNYYYGTNADNQRIGDANVDYGNTITQNAKVARVNTAAENNAAAARGLFESSIRDGALNDIAATQANNNNIALTNLHRLVGSLQADIGRLTTNWGIAQGTAAGEGVANAQAVTPTPSTTTTPNPNSQTPVSSSPNAGYIHRVQKNPANWRPPWASNPAMQAQKAKTNKKVAQHRMAGAKTVMYKGPQ